MTDDATGLALRDHLDGVLAGVVPSATLLDTVHAAHHRRVRRRAMALSSGAALTVAAATAAVVVGAAGGAPTTPDHKAHQPIPPASAPSYGTPKPQERWFAGRFAFPRPSGEVAVYPVHPERKDPADTRRSLLVWYSAPAKMYCAHDVLQTPDHPDGDDGPTSGGSCAALPQSMPPRTLLSSFGGECGSFEFVLGIVGVDAPKVEARAVGGPNPDVIIRRLDQAPAPFFLVVDAKAQALMMRYYDAGGHFLRYQMARIPVNARADANCAASQLTAVKPPG
ncbi:MAG: hypothetical protein QOD07_1899 [Frankiaceae bacterium]|jgi:hypothetical protein|nr:hypothetical protein [Frankiaceae bacterium]